MPASCISNIPLKMPFPCKSYPGRLAPLLSQLRNAAIMPTTRDHLPAQQPSHFPIHGVPILEAALTSKSAPDRQTQAAGFENWKDKVSEGQITLGFAFSGLVSEDLKGQSPRSLGTLDSTSLSCPHEHFTCSLYTQQAAANSIIINQLVIFKATYAQPSLGFRIDCLHVLQVLS